MIGGFIITGNTNKTVMIRARPGTRNTGHPCRPIPVSLRPRGLITWNDDCQQAG
jgi:hypothetical protein